MEEEKKNAHSNFQQGGYQSKLGWPNFKQKVIELAQFHPSTNPSESLTTKNKKSKQKSQIGKSKIMEILIFWTCLVGEEMVKRKNQNEKCGSSTNNMISILQIPCQFKM